MSTSRTATNASLTSTSSTSVHGDYKDDRVARCIYWTTEEVSQWIEDLGFPYYKECFTSNLINGRKLIIMDSSTLPKIGITDFLHIKTITKSIRDMLQIEDPNWFRTISIPPRDDLGMYLEVKSKTGQNIDELTYKSYEQSSVYRDAKWQPPLANHCLILPH